jgi:hypothetical protein
MEGKAMKYTYQERLQMLEAERLDTSYKNPPPKPFRYAPEHSPTLTKRERKLWFDAGRYEAGARDRVAEKAALQIRKLAGQD